MTHIIQTINPHTPILELLIDNHFTIHVQDSKHK